MEKKIVALVKNAEAFAEKGQQVSPSEFIALGIILKSRYGKVAEIVSMLRFAEAAAHSAVAHYVKELFFDSKYGACSFVLDETVLKGSEIERELFRIAEQTVGTFFWFDEQYPN